MDKIGIYDIEALNDIEYMNFVVSGFFDGKDMFYHYSIKDYLDFILKDNRYNEYKIFSHYGGKYDFMFLLNDLSKFKKKFKISFKEIGGRIIEIKISKKGFLLQLIDSYNFFRTSLSKLTFAFDVKHKKLEHSHKKDFIINDENLKYLKYDCVGLYEVFQSYLKVINISDEELKITLAAQSMYLYYQRFSEKYKKDLISLDSNYENFIRKGYYGGRSEVFKFSGKNLYYYDVNSLYPFCMLQKIPCGNYNKSLDIDMPGFYDVLVKSSNHLYPILPYRVKNKLIFPNGTFRGVYSSCELNFALARGYQILKIYDGVGFNKYDYIFNDYVDYFYKLKKNSKSETERYIAKMHLNSLYGKFGQRRELTEWTFLDKLKDDYYIEELETGLFSRDIISKSNKIIPSISAWITSLARIELYKWFELVNFDIYYCDTDSIFTQTELNSKYINDEIGFMKNEIINNNLQNNYNFNFSKDYYLADNYENILKDEHGNSIYEKIKGFSKKINNERLAGVKSAIKNISISEIKNTYLKKQKINRKNKIKIYDKREIIKNNETIPFFIN